jgi:hypothetical protein
MLTWYCREFSSSDVNPVSSRKVVPGGRRAPRKSGRRITLRSESLAKFYCLKIDSRRRNSILKSSVTLSSDQTGLKQSRDIV